MSEPTRYAELNRLLADQTNDSLWDATVCRAMVEIVNYGMGPEDAIEHLLRKVADSEVV